MKRKVLLGGKNDVSKRIKGAFSGQKRVVLDFPMISKPGLSFSRIHLNQN